MILTLKVEDIRAWDRVDLMSDPLEFVSLEEFPIIEYEYIRVISAEEEMEGCVTIDFEGIDQVVYPVGTELIVYREEE